MYFAAEGERRKRIVAPSSPSSSPPSASGSTRASAWKKASSSRGASPWRSRSSRATARPSIPPPSSRPSRSSTDRLNALGNRRRSHRSPGTDGIFLQMPGVGQDKLKEIQAALEQSPSSNSPSSIPRASSSRSRLPTAPRSSPGYEALPLRRGEGQGRQAPSDALRPRQDQTRHVRQERRQRGILLRQRRRLHQRLLHRRRRQNHGTPDDGEPEPASRHHPRQRHPFLPRHPPALLRRLPDHRQLHPEEALALASALENPLENPIEIEFSNYISPTMVKPRSAKASSPASGASGSFSSSW